MTIYADELFVINFIACFALLYIFAAARELERNPVRLSLAAAIGAFAAVIRFCCFNCTLFIFGDIVIALIAFKRIKAVNIFTFIITKYLLSGIAVFILSLYGKSDAIIKNGIIYADINAVVFAVIFAVIYPIFTLVARLFKAKRKIYTVQIRVNGADTVVRALYDSGNLLKNPYDGSSVIIADKDSIPFDEAGGYMLIPFRTLGNSGMLRAFRADEIICFEKNISLKNITIGISDTTLSKTGEYRALIGPGIFKE